MTRRLFPLLTVLAAMLLLSPVRAQDDGSGWRLTYYNTTDLSGTVAATGSAARLDLDFNGNPGLLPPEVSRNRFSLVAQTQQSFAEGSYEFQAGSDDGVRVYVDGQIIINSFDQRTFQPAQDTAVIFLTAAIHTVRVEYFNAGGDARLQVDWAFTRNVLAEVPSGAVLPLSGGPFGNGQVVTVEGLSVRSGPYLGATLLTSIEPGTTFPVFARNDQEGEFTWYLINARPGSTPTQAATAVPAAVATLDPLTTATPITAPTAVPQTSTRPPLYGWVSGRYFLLNFPQSTVPSQASVFETLTNPPSTGIQGITRSNLRMRQFPSYRTPTLQILDWGAEFEILSRTIQGRENFWYQVNHEGQLGWVYAPYVTIIGNIDGVPDY